MENFTPLASLFGGALIGISAMLLAVGLGKIAGISGIIAGASGISSNTGDRAWQLVFMIGMLVAGAVSLLLLDGGSSALAANLPPSISLDSSYLLLAIGGLLVGFGTRLGSGCTSGHGVCGIGRRSLRSVTATITFMAVAAITVYIQRHVLGG